ncbi:MAG: tail protein X [Pseudomonadota bacterium]|jgi:phage tail protein X
MSGQHLEHITRAGERWDSIAWHYYRDVRQIARLLDANPHLAASALLPSGQVLRVPLIEAAPAAAPNPAALPPWRRA